MTVFENGSGSISIPDSSVSAAMVQEMLRTLRSLLPLACVVLAVGSAGAQTPADRHPKHPTLRSIRQPATP